MKITLDRIPGGRAPQVRVAGDGGVDLEEAADVAALLQDWKSGLPTFKPYITIDGGQVKYHSTHHFSERMLLEFGRWLDLWRIKHDLYPDTKKPAPDTDDDDLVYQPELGFGAQPEAPPIPSPARKKKPSVGRLEIAKGEFNLKLSHPSMGPKMERALQERLWMREGQLSKRSPKIRYKKCKYWEQKPEEISVKMRSGKLTIRPNSGSDYEWDVMVCKRLLAEFIIRNVDRQIRETDAS